MVQMGPRMRPGPRGQPAEALLALFLGEREGVTAEPPPSGLTSLPGSKATPPQRRGFHQSLQQTLRQARGPGCPVEGARNPPFPRTPLCSCSEAAEINPPAAAWLMGPLPQVSCLAAMPGPTSPGLRGSLATPFNTATLPC